MCLDSSAVEQLFCKQQVPSPNLGPGSKNAIYFILLNSLISNELIFLLLLFVKKTSTRSTVRMKQISRCCSPYSCEKNRNKIRRPMNPRKGVILYSSHFLIGLWHITIFYFKTLTLFTYNDIYKNYFNANSYLSHKITVLNSYISHTELVEELWLRDI